MQQEVRNWVCSPSKLAAMINRAVNDLEQQSGVQNWLVAKYTATFINTREDQEVMVLTGKARCIAEHWVEILSKLLVERDNLKVFITYRPSVLD